MLDKNDYQEEPSKVLHYKLKKTDCIQKSEGKSGIRENVVPKAINPY